MKAPNNPITIRSSSWRKAITLNWQPKPLAPPRVSRGFAKLNQLERTAEVLRYSISQLECWLSPGGMLREWLRFNLVTGTVLSIPALMVVPLVTYLLGQFATWTALLRQIGSNLIVFPLTMILGIALLSGAILLTRLLLRR